MAKFKIGDRVRDPDSKKEATLIEILDHMALYAIKFDDGFRTTYPIHEIDTYFTLVKEKPDSIPSGITLEMMKEHPFKKLIKVLNENEQEIEILKELKFIFNKCAHEYKQYHGLSESFTYCTKCDYKK